MMDTGAPQLHLPAVDAQAVLRIQFQPANTEMLPRLIQKLFARINLHYTIVQLRRVRTPQFRLKQCDPLTDLLLCLHKHGHAHFIHTHHGSVTK